MLNDMKNMKTSAKIATVISLTLGGLILLGGLLFSAVAWPLLHAYVESAPVLEEATLLPENEGGPVILQGSITAPTPVREPFFGLAFDSPIVRYSVSEYRYFVKEGRFTSASGSWGWEHVDDLTLTVPAHIGEFELDDRLVAAIPLPVTATPADVVGTPTAPYYATDEGAFSSVDITGALFSQGLAQGKAFEGTLCYSYELPRPGETYTVLGIQRDGRLIPIRALASRSLRLGTLSAEELADDLTDSFWLASLLAVILSVPFLYIGFWNIHQQNLAQKASDTAPEKPPRKKKRGD